jgi:D-inositol-3-phosphate glycosyltransferase
MHRVAVVAPNISRRGGVRTVVEFLCDTMERSGRYAPEIISLASSASDDASVRLLHPASWFRGIRTTAGDLGPRPFRHVGARLPELELRRYAPRRELTALLNEYDLIQVVSGTPAWAHPAADVTKPVTLQVATLMRTQRAATAARDRNVLRRAWSWANMELTSRLEDTALQRVDACFVENREMYDHVSRLLPAERVIFAPPGVDADRFRPMAANETTSRAPYILSVGRFADPRKNVRMLFRAYAEVRRLVPNAPRLVLAGRTAPSPHDMPVADSEGVAGWVDVLTDISADELARLYRGASVFALSSDEEGLGLVITEAMASGIAVASTACGGPSTLVEEGRTGFLTPVGDASALARSIAQLLTDDDRRRAFGKAARDRVLSHFSMEATSRAFLDVYDALVAARPSTSRPAHVR